jgi:hypothetical protein
MSEAERINPLHSLLEAIDENSPIHSDSSVGEYLFKGLHRLFNYGVKVTLPEYVPFHTPGSV